MALEAGSEEPAYHPDAHHTFIPAHSRIQHLFLDATKPKVGLVHHIGAGGVRQGLGWAAPPARCWHWSQQPTHTHNTGSGGGKALRSCIQHILMIKVQLPTHSTPLAPGAKTNAKEILLSE